VLRHFNPTSPESAVDGTVQKVVGRIQANENEFMQSPLSGRSCVYYRIEVQQWQT